eukprot:Gregarina_sp_Poly_1__4583@NODE_2458_length_2112_cov_410_754034_g1556_i0_p2_GENE_NODE_2458_length_2112_cov_410_754034_g1556_i0NODE_2458_length_2112_cov_410_754034_g1556_i0_p2_ORF_typecomplete_len126_score25_80_NODE_2458_length_2112_cov_410_754034_g1556_i07501127
MSPTSGTSPASPTSLSPVGNASDERINADFKARICPSFSETISSSPAASAVLGSILGEGSSVAGVPVPCAADSNNRDQILSLLNATEMRPLRSLLPPSRVSTVAGRRASASRLCTLPRGSPALNS